MAELALLAQASTRNLVASGIGVLLGILLGLWYVRRDRRRRGEEDRLP